MGSGIDRDEKDNYDKQKGNLHEARHNFNGAIRLHSVELVFIAEMNAALDLTWTPSEFMPMRMSGNRI